MTVLKTDYCGAKGKQRSQLKEVKKQPTKSQHSTMNTVYVIVKTEEVFALIVGDWLIIESVDSICRDSADTQYMLIQTKFSKSPKQLTYKPL